MCPYAPAIPTCVRLVRTTALSPHTILGCVKRFLSSATALVRGWAAPRRVTHETHARTPSHSRSLETPQRKGIAVRRVLHVSYMLCFTVHRLGDSVLSLTINSRDPKPLSLSFIGAFDTACVLFIGSTRRSQSSLESGGGVRKI